MGKLLIPRRTLLKAAPFVLAAPAILRSRPAFAAYTGPGDITAFAAWYGLRAYSAATAGTKCIQVNGTTDISTTAGGDFNFAAYTAAGGAGQITKLYDQSGNGKDAPQQGGVGPTVSNSILGSGGRAGIVSAFGVSEGFTTTATFSQAQPFGYSAYSQRTTDFGSQQDIISFHDGAVTHIFGYLNASSTVYIYNGSVASVTASDSAPHAFQVLFNNAASIIVVDSTVTGSLGPGTGSVSVETISLAGRFAAGNTMAGYTGEMGFLTSDVGSTVRTNLANNQLAYYAGAAPSGGSTSLMMSGAGQ